MKLTVKPLNGKVFEVEADGEETVESLKQRIAELRPEFPADLSKLIFTSKILANSSQLKEYGLKEGDFFVIMVAKAQAKAAPKPEEAPREAATPAPAAAPAAAPTPQPAQDEGYTEENVNLLMAMGFPRESVVQCLQAARNNPDMAVEFLTTGIPEGLSRGGGGGVEPFPALHAGGDGDPEAVAALEELRSHPRFMELAQLVLENPDALDQILTTLDETHPRAADAIRTHPEAFVELLQDAVGDAEGEGEEEEGEEDALDEILAGHPGGDEEVELTAADEPAIERLTAMGFDRNAAVQAFLICDKNEALASNYLLDNLED